MPSTSVAVNVPVAVCTALLSVKALVLVPVITAASLAPLIVTVTTCVVPSAVFTVNVSVSVCPTFNACTVVLLLLSV